jgi:phosphatidylserine/phosphatidylglycerophosphate/cardiolipin synthase-like enzyme
MEETPDRSAADVDAFLQSRDDLAAGPGETCWRIERATRAAVIIDAEDYFRAAREAMLKAKKQILLVGWDFDARIRLTYEGEDEAPETVGAFISWLVERTPELEVYLLRWDIGAIKTFFRPRTLVTTLAWMARARSPPSSTATTPPAARTTRRSW